MIYLIPTDTCFWIACSLSDIKAYEKIYQIKKRNLSKPLAIMVSDFKWLEKYSNLTKEQIEFLKKYDKAFTVLTDSDYIKMWINLEDENEMFPNNNVYKKIAFRVANNETEKKLIKEIWPIFLTSANLSDKPEIYKIKDLEDEFSYYLDKKIVEIKWSFDLNPKNKTSDIFEFVWDSLEVKYLRKN